mgnify:CR=1 FL=1
MPCLRLKLIDQPISRETAFDDRLAPRHDDDSDDDASEASYHTAESSALSGVSGHVAPAARRGSLLATTIFEHLSLIHI